MIEALAEEQAKRFFGRLWEDTLGYLRLYEFLKLRASATLSDRTVRVSSVAEFWHGILGDRFSDSSVRYHPIREGDIIRLEDVFLTEWAPKLPGQIWTAEGAIDLERGLRFVEGRRRYGEEMYVILNPWGKRTVLNAGYGSVRPCRSGAVTSRANHFAYMALVGKDQWNSDYGVPVVVSRPIFDQFQRYGKLGAPWVKTLEGVVRTGSDLPLTQVIPHAIGADLSRESEESLRYRPGLPRCYVEIVSPLSVTLAHNDSHPDITAWTMYATGTAGKTPRHMEEPYGYSYVKLNPLVSGAYDKAASFLRHYARDHGGVSLVTDFDGVVPRLAAEIPITGDPLAKSRRAAKKLVRGLDRWTEKVLRAHSRALGRDPSEV